MALAYSTPMAVGTPLPPFMLPDTRGRMHTPAQLAGPKGLLVAFTCNHCPYAVAVWERLVRLAQEAAALGIGTAAINPNIHPDYPEDAPEKMAALAQRYGVAFPYLVDAMQESARAFDARCTPDFYLFDAQGQLYYRGRMDDAWQDERRVSRRDLADAMRAMISHMAAPSEQIPSMGCSIKWKEGEKQ